MKYQFCILLFTLLYSLFAQQDDPSLSFPVEEKGIERKKLAVLPFSCPLPEFQNLAQELLSYITSEFYSDTYSLIERVQIQDIIKEKLWKKTHLEEKDIQEIFDSIESAEYLMIGSISKNSTQWCIEYRIVKMDGSIVSAHRIAHTEWIKAQEGIGKSILKAVNVQLHCRLQAKEFDDFYVLEQIKSFLYQKEQEQKLHIVHFAWTRKTLQTHFLLKNQNMLEFIEEIKKEIPGIFLKVHQNNITISPD